MTDQPQRRALPQAPFRRDSRRPQLIAAVLCVLAVAAVVITAPAVLIAWRVGASGPEPLAPGLAALSGKQLADLLPKQSDFPAGWSPKDTHLDV